MELPAECQGPKMQALANNLQRRFAYLMACGDLDRGECARAAGYSGSAEAMRVRASENMHNPAVLDAIEEAGRKVLRGLAPIAMAKLKEILLSPNVKIAEKARVAETILDRTGHFARTEHKVTVEHTVDTAELEKLAIRLAQEAGIDPARLIGRNDPKLIEGKVVKE